LIFTDVPFHLWEVPWKSLITQHVKTGNKEPLCVRILTERVWATRNRIGYNKDKEVVHEWRQKVDKAIRALRKENYYNTHTLIDGLEIRVKWKGGEDLVQIYRRGMCNEIHDYINASMTEHYWRETNAQNHRRGTSHVEPLHMAPHSFCKMGNQQNTHYGGLRNVIRFPAEVEDANMFAKTAPQWVWSNSTYKKISPETYETICRSNRTDLNFCGFQGANQFVKNFTPILLHNDPLDTSPALLGYYHGPFAEAWTGGELEIPETGLGIQVLPQDLVLLDSILYHFVRPVNGVRFSTGVYNKNLTKTAVLPNGFEWVTKKYFGLPLGDDLMEVI